MRWMAILALAACTSEATTTVVLQPAPKKVAAADPDRDHDGIPNTCDCCPDEPETFQGIDDDDGCPDKCILRVGDPLDNALAPAGWIEGEPTPAAIDAAAANLRASVDVEAVMCIGQAAKNEPAKESIRRAKIVCDGLVSRGIPRTWLSGVGVGHGEMRHIASVPAEAPRAITLVQIVRAGGKIVWVWDGTVLQEGQRNPPHVSPGRCGAC